MHDTGGERRSQHAGVLVAAAVLPPLLAWNLQPLGLAAWLSGGTAQRGHAELLLVNGVALLLPWLPPLLGRVPPATLGLARGTGRGWLAAVALWAGMLPFLGLAAGQPAFQATYPLLREARGSWALFAVHSAAMALYFLLWEALFRGLLSSVLARRLGPAVGIGIQAAAFGALHAGKPLPELLGSFGAGVVLGVLALRARSFLPAAALHTACAFTLDLLICAGLP